MRALKYKMPTQKCTLRSYLGIQGPLQQEMSTKNKRKKKPRVHIPSTANIIEYPKRQYETTAQNNKYGNTGTQKVKKQRESRLSDFVGLLGTRFVHKSIEELPGNLEIRASFGGPVETIKRLQPFEPHESLGCQLCVDNNQKPQLELLKTLMNDWVRKIQPSNLSNYDKLHAYKTCLEKKLVYVLVLTSLTYTQCKDLDKLISPLNLFTCTIATMIQLESSLRYQ